MLGFVKPSPRNILQCLLIRSSFFFHSATVSASSVDGVAAVRIGFLPPPNPPLPLDKLESSFIISSFSDWFRRGYDPFPALLDQIYSAIASSDDGSAINAVLFRLRLRLSEDFVLRFLRHHPHPSAVPPSPDASSTLLQLRIRFFDWCSRQPGYFHSRSVYHALFRHLYRHRHVSFVMECLRRFSATGHISLSAAATSATSSGSKGHPRYCQALVIGYAVTGCAERALQLFARMRYHGLDLDDFCYHVLLNSLVEASLFEFADSVFTHIDARGLAGPVTACIRVKSLCRQGRLDDAAAYLRELYLCDQLVADRTVGTLVQALCKAGRVDCAGQIVEEFSSSEAYSVWISHLLSAEKFDTAMEFLRKKKGIDTDRSLLEISQYNYLIQQLLRRNMLGEVCDVLVEMMEEGISPDQNTMDVTLCFFCKAGMVDVAIELYNLKTEIGVAPKRTVYNHLINALCKDGNVDEVLKVIEESMSQGYFPGNQTFTRLANVLLRKGKLEKLGSLLAEALKRKLRSTIPIQSRYLSALCKIGAVKEAYSDLLTANGVGAGVVMYKSTYCNLIRAFIKLRMVQFPPGLLIQMQELGFVPGRRLYREVVFSLCEMNMFDVVFSLLNRQLEIRPQDPWSCYNYIIDGAAHSKKPEMAMEVYSRMVNAGIEPNLCTDILILRCYLKSSHFGKAFRFFRLLKEKHMMSTKLYNVFIHGLCEAGKSEHAVEIWREMRERELLPSLQCYEELVRALCLSSSYDLVIRVIKDFKETGRQVSSFILNVLLLHILKSQKLLLAWDQSNVLGDTNLGVLNQQSKLSVDVILEYLMKEFSNGLRMKDNLEKFDELIEQYFPIDIYTYNVLLRGSFMARRMDFAFNLFRRIQDKGYEPNRWTYDIMVHGFCKLGYRKCAEKWMEEMSLNGYQPTWYTLTLYNNTP
ncbi:Pentatricopeptide repeat-containing protein [Platanthera zijinensis]|uniref:Pentatricopeptide repeat-containing protein n=1 Tax=Platanthera zijinensis TaxID=2320716 RepID=A0AAP0FU30_9ASPA